MIQFVTHEIVYVIGAIIVSLMIANASCQKEKFPTKKKKVLQFILVFIFCFIVFILAGYMLNNANSNPMFKGSFKTIAV